MRTTMRFKTWLAALTLMLLAIGANAQSVEFIFNDTTGGTTPGAAYIGDFTTSGDGLVDTLMFVPSGDFFTAAAGASAGALRKAAAEGSCGFGSSSQIQFDPNNADAELYLNSTAVKEVVFYAYAKNTNSYLFHAMGDGAGRFWDIGNAQNTQSNQWVTGTPATYLHGLNFPNNKTAVYSFKNTTTPASPIMVKVEVLTASRTFVISPTDGNFIRLSGSGACLKYTIVGMDIPQGGKLVWRSPARANLQYQKMEVNAVATVVPVAEVAISGASATIPVDGTFSLSAAMLPAEASFPVIEWSVVSGTATVSKIGAVSGLTTPGIVKIAATVPGTTVADTVEFEVVPVAATSVEINIPAGKKIVGQMYSLTSTVQPTTTTFKNVTWSIAEVGTTGAEISKEGVLTATAAGTVKVRALVDSTPAIVADSDIVFEVQLVENVVISGNPTATVGTWYSQTWQALALPVEATNRSVTWSSDNEAVATVDANSGLVTAVGTGTAKITASSVDGGASNFANITVDASIGGVLQEQVVIYENFGGVGTTEAGIQPTAWAAITTNEGPDDAAIRPRGGWRNRTENVNGKGLAMVALPQPSSQTYYRVSNMLAHAPELAAQWTANGIIINADSSLTKTNVPLRNGYTVNGATTVGFKMVNMAVLPHWYNGICYDTMFTPGGKFTMAPNPGSNNGWDRSYVLPANNKSMHCSRPDELGYLFFASGWIPGATPETGIRPNFTIPAEDTAYLTKVTKVNVVFSGTRTNNPNMLVVIADYYNGTALASSDTTTYTVNTYGVREVTVPLKNAENNKVKLRFYSSDYNAHLADYEVNGTAGSPQMPTGLMASNGQPANIQTGITAVAPFNRAGFISRTNAGNMGLNITSFKVYALVDASGYSVIVNGAASVSKSSGIKYGEKVTVTATSADFVGWRINGREDLSEVVNPLEITVTENMEIAPLYAGDLAVVPVVNENFINWEPSYTGYKGDGDDATSDALGLISFANNGTKYGIDSAYAALTKSGVKVPLYFGAATDSIDVDLKYINSVPDRTIRVGNAPGAEKWMGYLGFGAYSNTDKGYVKLTNLPATGIKKAVMEFSAYEATPTNNVNARAVAVFVNNAPKRNFADQWSFRAKQETLDLSAEASLTDLTIGYANQVPHEYGLVSSNTNTPDLTGTNTKNTLSAGYSLMHSMKVYAEVALPAIAWKQLTVSHEGEGATFAYPDPNNSTSMYPAGTNVTLLAKPAVGYGFDKWIDAEDSTELGIDALLTLPLAADRKVKAIFAQNPSYVIVTDILEEEGEIFPALWEEKGTVTYSEPQMEVHPAEGSADSLVYLAGVAGVKLTAAPKYGYALADPAWEVYQATEDGDTVIAVGTITGGDITFTGAEMVKERVLKLVPKFDEVMDREALVWITDVLKGDLEFNDEFYYDQFSPNVSPLGGDTVTADIPSGSTLKITPVAKEDYRFVDWVRDSIFRQDTLQSSSLGDSIVTVFDRFVFDAPDADGNLVMDTFKMVKASWININDKLKSITVSVGGELAQLSPAFDPEVRAYTVNVPNETASVLVSAEPQADEAQGITALPSIAAPVTLNANGRTVNISVKPEDVNAAAVPYVVNIRKTAPTAVAANEQANFNLYPNPVVGSELVVEGEVREGEQITVYGVSGVLVATFTAAGEKTNLNVSKLASGTYLIKIGNSVVKFVKQ